MAGADSPKQILERPLRMTAAGATQLPSALTGDRREIQARSGKLSYYVAGNGPPLLLVHSINAAASAYEVKPIFDRALGARRVYAVDLPGFGFSDRSDRTYDITLYVAALEDMLDVIAADFGGRVAVDALAVSLSSEFLARIVARSNDKFRTLTLVTPTGFDARSANSRGGPGETREVPGLYAVLKVPLWSSALFNLLVSERGVRYFLRRTFGSDRIDEGLVRYDYITAHQPGARFAPLAFVSGRLFSKDIRAVYEKVSVPVWVPHGTRGDFDDFSGADWLVGRSNWSVQAYATGALPHFEEPDQFMTDFNRFLAAQS
jgi:pimeloyl-ACP methyl ester carboxylesterase